MRTIRLWALTLFTAVYAGGVSKTGLCGAANKGLICTGSSYGNCCSQYGWCGSTPAHCGTGCDPAYGSCTSSGPVKKVSSDGSCGDRKGQTCQGSIFGNCCSTHGYCGSTPAYCGTGCKPAFGTCAHAEPHSSHTPTTLQTSTTASTAPPSSTLKVSVNARCGDKHGATGEYTCKGSIWGDCCSQYSYCGSTKAYCGTGCQSGFGQCNGAPPSMSSSYSAQLPSSSSVAIESPTPPSSQSTSSSSSLVSSFTEVSSSSSSMASSTSLDSSSAPVASSTSQISSSSILDISSTPSVSATPTETAPSASSTQPCYVAPTNYVTNGGFESGNADGFTLVTVRSTFSVSDLGAYSGTWLGRGSITSSNGASNTNIEQRNIMIPSGTRVYWYAMMRSLRTDASASGIQRFRIFLDNVNGGTVAYATNEWVKVGGLVSRELVGNTHTLLITVENSGGWTGPAFEIDDISIVPVSGPVGVPVCAAPSPSSSVPSSTPTLESTSTAIPVETSTSAAETPSTTPDVTPTSTPTFTGCIATPTNYLSNPSFDSPGQNNLSPWVNGGMYGPWADIGKSNLPGEVHSPHYAFRVSTSDSTEASIYLDQPDLAIPDGTQVKARVFFKILRPADNVSGSVTIQLSIQSGAVGRNMEQRFFSVTPDPDSGEYGRWIQLESPLLHVVGDVHTFRVFIMTEGYAGDIIAVDDLELVMSCEFER